MSIARKSAIDASSQVAVTLLSMVAGVLVSRFLGAEGRGRYLLATSLANGLLMDLTNAGLRLTGQVFVAREPGKLARVHTGIVVCCAAIGAVAGIALWLLRELVASHVLQGIRAGELGMVAATLAFQLYLVCWHGLMIGLGRVKDRALFEVGYQSVQTVAIGCVLLLTLRVIPFDSVLPLTVSYYGIVVLATGVMMAMLEDSGPIWTRPDRALLAEMLRYGGWVYGGNLAGSLQARIDQLIVNGMGSAAALGIYGQAANLAGRFKMISSALQNAAYRDVCASDDHASSRLVGRALRQIAIVGSVAVAGGWALAPAIPLIYGSEFEPSVLPFRLLVVAFVFNGFSMMLAMYFSGRLARPQIPMGINTALLPVQVILCAVLGHQLGALLGITLATLATNVLAAAAFLFLFLDRPETVKLGEILRFEASDFAPWRKFLRLDRFSLGTGKREG